MIVTGKIVAEEYYEFAEKVGAKAQEKPFGQFICVADQAMGMAVDKSRQSE